MSLEPRQSESPDPYPPGTMLRHHAGSLWRVLAYLGGEHDDRRICCLVGTERPGFVGGERRGRELVVHGEYIPRSFRIEVR